MTYTLPNMKEANQIGKSIPTYGLIGTVCPEIKSFQQAPLLQGPCPSPLCLSTYRAHGHRWVTHESLLKAHTAKILRSALFHGKISFLSDVYTTTHEINQSDLRNPSQCITLTSSCVYQKFDTRSVNYGAYLQTYFFKSRCNSSPSVSYVLLHPVWAISPWGCQHPPVSVWPKVHKSNASWFGHSLHLHQRLLDVVSPAIPRGR